MVLTEAEKDEVYECVKAKMKQVLPAAAPLGQVCLYWAVGGLLELRSRGIRSVIQGGSCSWPRIKLEEDDGVSPTHMSYVWSPGPTSILSQMLGHLPEMHVWLGIVETQEIIDFTTAYWPEACLKMTGSPWTGHAPPKYFWSHEFPERVYYSVDPDATMLAFHYGKGILKRFL